MFASSKDVQSSFDEKLYICSAETATSVYLAYKLQKPLLVEGPAGVGKTELAKVMAACLNRELIRMQCYEGLDETKALYEWEYSKQLLYTQILKEKIAETLKDANTLAGAVAEIANQESAFFSETFLTPRPLLKAIVSEEPKVLLIDEIDKADPEFEAFLLEILSDFQVSIPEIGTLSAKHVPSVILTSNNNRELSDGLRRRCLYLFLDFPAPRQEEQILRRKIPTLEKRLAEQVADAVHEIRKLGLRKPPSIGETLDWGRALEIMNARALTPEVITSSLPALVKSSRDHKTVIREIAKIAPSSSQAN